jgi:hypothetical protein
VLGAEIFAQNTLHGAVRQSVDRARGGDFSIKLEDQILFTATGCENLTRYPFDPALG